MPDGIINWAQLVEQAAAEGFGPEELYAPGSYQGVVVNTNVTESKNGKGQIGLRIQFEGGQYDGKAVWANQTLTTDNPKAMGAWFRTFAALGIPQDTWATQNLSLTDAAARCEGRRVKFTLKHREYPPGSGEKKNNVNITQGIEAGATAPVPPVPQAPAAAPVAPVTPPVAPPAAAPAAPAPAPAAAPAGIPEDQAAAFQAFLAQQQAQQAAPAAEAPPLPERGF